MQASYGTLPNIEGEVFDFLPLSKLTIVCLTSKVKSALAGVNSMKPQLRWPLSAKCRGGTLSVLCCIALTLGSHVTCDAQRAELTSEIEIADRMRTIYRLSTMGRRFKDSIAPAACGDPAIEESWRQLVVGSVQYPLDEVIIPAAGATRSELEVISLFSLERHIDQMTLENAKAKVQAVVGPGTFFEIIAKHPDELPSPTFVKPDNPISNAVLFVEVYERDLKWYEKGDFSIPDASKELSDEQFRALGNSRASFHVTFADGEVWRIRRDVPKELMTRFFYVDEAKQVNRESDLKKFVIDRLSPLPDARGLPEDLLPPRE